VYGTELSWQGPIPLVVLRDGAVKAQIEGHQAYPRVWSNQVYWAFVPQLWEKLDWNGEVPVPAVLKDATLLGAVVAAAHPMPFWLARKEVPHASLGQQVVIALQDHLLQLQLK